MRRITQRGFSFMEGLLVLGLCMGYIILVIRAWTPIQTQYYTKKILEETMQDPAIPKMTPDAVKNRLLNRMNINGVYDINQKNIKVTFDQEVMNFTINKDYEIQVWKFFYILIRIDEAAKVNRR